MQSKPEMKNTLAKNITVLNEQNHPLATALKGHDAAHFSNHSDNEQEINRLYWRNRTNKCCNIALYSTNTVLYSRTTVQYCRSTVLYSGSTILYSGNTTLYCMSTVLYSGSIVLYSGSTMLYSGTTTQYSDITVLSSGYTLSYPSEHLITKKQY